MSIHPARVIASVLLIAGSAFVSVMALGVVIAKLLVDAGMRHQPVQRSSACGPDHGPPVRRDLRRRGCRGGCRSLRGKRWSDDLAFGTAIAAVAVGAIELILLSVGRDPFASTASARSTDDGIGIIGAFTVLYLFVIVAVAVARLPRHSSTATGVMA